MRKRFNPKLWTPPPGYSHAVATAGGRLLYLSGQVPLDPAGNVVGAGDFEAQLTRVFENLQTVLETAGATFANVIRLGYFVVDLDADKVRLIRSVRRRFLLDDEAPASTLVGVHRLFHPEIQIEIEATAELTDER